MTRWFCLLALLPVCAAAQIVEGSVVNSVTGSGIAGVSVNLEQVTNGAYRVYQARTDEQGHVRLENVQDGMYRVHYASNDYWSDREFGDAERIQVAAGDKPVEMRARLQPLPHISGRVVDGRGNPVPGADVVSSGNGMFFNESTDAAGRFELKERPGSYAISATAPRDWKAPDADPETRQPMGWAQTFYPGVTTPEAATRLVLRPGVDVSDIEIKLRALPVHTARGVVLGIDGKPAAKAVIDLGDEQSLQPRREAETGADGTFEFTGLTDGGRTLTALAQSGGGMLRARQRFEMAGRDVEGIRLQLEPPFTLHGHVVMETPRGMTPPRMPTLVLRSVDQERESPFTELMSARPDGEGKFTFRLVYPGTYRIDDAMAPGVAYLDSVRLGESDLPSFQMELTSGAAPLVVTYKSDGGTVRGTVEKCEQGEVLLIPDAIALRRAGMSRSGRCDANGHYEIGGLRPGEYYALALSRPASSPFPDAEWDDGTLAQGQRVTVRAGEFTTADLRLLTRQGN